MLGERLCAVQRLGQPKVDHLGHRRAIVLADQDVRWFQVTVNDALLMSVLDGGTDLNKQLQPLPHRELPVIAVVRQRNALDQLHDKVGTTRTNAAGLAANMTINPFESVTTVTTQIVQLLTGDQEFDSAKTLAAFALGLALFIITLILNLIALRVVRKYREAYE